jgi:pimeloyl-ACP methyl ester carboxylesterase
VGIFSRGNYSGNFIFVKISFKHDADPLKILLNKVNIPQKHLYCSCHQKVELIKMKKKKYTLLRGLKLLVVTYIFLCCFMYLIQRQLMYAPSGEVKLPVEIGLPQYQHIFIKTLDDETLRAWYHKKPNSADVILYFHGNKKSLENRRDKYKAFANHSELSVLALSYRGYPGSTGTPTESGLYLDGEAAVQFLIRQGYQEKNIILYGESLGTGVATEMATEIDAKALILESPFTNMTDAAKTRHWFLPVSLLLKDRFDNKAKIQQLNLPILIIHGAKDKIVPLRLGKELANSYHGPKSLVTTSNNGHMNFSGKFLITQIKQFLAKNKELSRAKDQRTHRQGSDSKVYK